MISYFLCLHIVVVQHPLFVNPITSFKTCLKIAIEGADLHMFIYGLHYWYTYGYIRFIQDHEKACTLFVGKLVFNAIFYGIFLVNVFIVIGIMHAC